MKIEKIKIEEKIKIDVVGLHTDTKAYRYIQDMENLLKALSGDKNLKLNVNMHVYCADCGAKFKTFAQLQKHMKATGHTDAPEDMFLKEGTKSD